MNFRQRFAWLSLAIFLLCTFAFVYYIFEISDAYNKFALDHVEHFHKPLRSRGDKVIKAENKDDEETTWKFWTHLADIPLGVWIIIFIFPYLQVFSILLACTKPDPQYSLALLWPIYIYLKVRRCFINDRTHNLKPTVQPHPNGHVVDIT